MASRMFSAAPAASLDAPPAAQQQSQQGGGHGGGAAQDLLVAFGDLRAAPSGCCDNPAEYIGLCTASRDSLDYASTACGSSVAGSSRSLASSAESCSSSSSPGSRLSSPARLGIMSSIFAAKAAEKDYAGRLPSAERSGIMSSVFAAKAAANVHSRR